jgi:hypothetical protein
MGKHHGSIAVRSRSAEVAAVDGVALTGTVFMLFFPERGVEQGMRETAKAAEVPAVVG